MKVGNNSAQNGGIWERVAQKGISRGSIPTLLPSCLWAAASAHLGAPLRYVRIICDNEAPPLIGAAL